MTAFSFHSHDTQALLGDAFPLAQQPSSETSVEAAPTAEVKIAPVAEKFVSKRLASGHSILDYECIVPPIERGERFVRVKFDSNDKFIPAREIIDLKDDELSAVLLHPQLNKFDKNTLSAALGNLRISKRTSHAWIPDPM